MVNIRTNRCHVMENQINGRKELTYSCRNVITAENNFFRHEPRYSYVWEYPPEKDGKHNQVNKVKRKVLISLSK